MQVALRNQGMPARLASKTFACDAAVITERSLLREDPSMSERRELSIRHRTRHSSWGSMSFCLPPPPPPLLTARPRARPLTGNFSDEIDRPKLAGSSCPSPRHIPVIGGDRLGTVAGAAAVVAILAATVLSC